MDLKCLCCEHEFEGAISKDELGWHSVCEDCGSSFDVAVPEGRIVVAFTNPNYDSVEPYKNFEQDSPVENICAYYVFATPDEFVNKWYEMVENPAGMWYWVIDTAFEYPNGEIGELLITSGACDPGDIEIFNDAWALGKEEDIDVLLQETPVPEAHVTLTDAQRQEARAILEEVVYADMSADELKLVVAYETEQYKTKVDELFKKGWPAGMVSDKVQEWYADYRMADGTADALYVYIEIIEYLGIEPEFIDENVNREAIREAETVEAKYKDAIVNETLAYSFHSDVCRFFDNEKETVSVVEKMKHITVFEVKSKDQTVEREAPLVDRISDAQVRSGVVGPCDGKSTDEYVKE